MNDAVDYLRVTFMCLTYLPAAIREAVHFASCSHVAAVLLRALLAAPKLNAYSLHRRRLDVACLEEFADGCGVADLRLTFAELATLLEALVGAPDALDALPDATERARRFPHLDVAKVITVLGRCHDVPMIARVKGGGGGAAHELPKFDRKHVDRVLRQLRAEQS